MSYVIIPEVLAGPLVDHGNHFQHPFRRTRWILSWLTYSIFAPSPELCEDIAHLSLIPFRPKSLPYPVPFIDLYHCIERPCPTSRF